MVTISREPYVRARFVGALCAVFLAPLYLAAVTVPASLWYTVGVAVPFSYFAYRCLFSGSHRLAGVLPLAAYRAFYIGSFVVAVAIHLAVRVELAISWYASGVAFLLGEPMVRDVLVAFGFGTRYSFDRDE